jgi:hypothetical protein
VFAFASLALVFLGSRLIVGTLGVTKPNRATATLVLAVATICVLGVLLGTVDEFRSAALTWGSVGFFGLSAGVWRLRRCRGVAAGPVTPPTEAEVPPRAVGRAAVFGLLLAVNVLEYAWRAVIALRLPPLGYDSLYYHLVNVETWVRTGSLDRPFSGLSHVADPGSLTQADTFPKNTELVGGWLAATSGSFAAVGLTQLVFVVLLATATTGICRSVGISAPSARIAGVLPGLCPVALAQSSELYVDIARAATVMATLHLLLAAFARRETGEVLGSSHPDRSALLILSGTALGLAIGTKSNNLIFVPVILAAATVLLLAEVRWQNGAAADSELVSDSIVLRWQIQTWGLILVPALCVGAYWYLRAWVFWGSPFWPYGEGPFSGRSDFASTDSTMRLYYGTDSAPSALLGGWWKAIHEFTGQIRGDQRVGGLGLTWLLLGVPLLVVGVLSARRYRRAVFAAALPIVAGTLAAPSSYNTRYSIPLTVAGAIAIAVSLDRLTHRPGGAAPDRRPRLRLRAGAVLLCAALLGTSLSDAWAATRTANWYLDPRRGDSIASLDVEIRDVAADRGVRRELGYAPFYADALSQVPPGAAIAFFADEVPQLTYPLTGAEHDHPLVVLPPAESSTADVLEAGFPRAVYLYLPTGVGYLPTGVGLIAQFEALPSVKLLGPVWDGVLLRVPGR